MPITKSNPRSCLLTVAVSEAEREVLLSKKRRKQSISDHLHELLLKPDDKQHLEERLDTLAAMLQNLSLLVQQQAYQLEALVMQESDPRLPPSWADQLNQLTEGVNALIDLLAADTAEPLR